MNSGHMRNYADAELIRRYKVKKKKYEKDKGLTGMGIDYSIYRMSRVQILICSAAGAAAGISAWCVFFGAGFHALASVIPGVLAGIRTGRKYFGEKRKKELVCQFRDFLDSVAASVSAGRNVTGAIQAAGDDMRQIYGENGIITRETALIVNGMRNNINPEELFLDFARRSGIKDAEIFADTFCVCNRTGGNMRDVILRTTRILSEKIQTENEIEVIASKGRNELMIMTAMPFIIIPMLKTLGESGVSGNNPVTIAVRAAGALLIVLSCLAGRKITDIKI